MVDDMSESDLSLPDDESSFHPSDYSESSVDDRPAATQRDKILAIQPSIETFQPEVVPRTNQKERVIRKAPYFSSINTSASGSSGGSPWVDDTGSSSSTSSDTSKSRIILSISEQIRFDEARERLKQAQKRPRSSEKSKAKSFDSAASVSTGKHPLKPIDVTDAHDLLKERQILERLQYGRLKHEDSMRAALKSMEVIKIRSETSKSRIVGILPSITEGQDIKMQDWNRNSKATARPVPPIIVPEFCSPADDLSSLGGTHSDGRGFRTSHRNSLVGGDDTDLEQGNVGSKNGNESRTTMGWIEQRTNLELFLIFSVASSSIALIALLIIMFSR